MQELIKKTYQINLLGEILIYEQASYYECLEYHYLLQQKDFKIDEWLYNFLKDKINLKKEDLLKLDLEKTMNLIYDTRFKGFFSKKANSKDDGMPFEAYISLISEKLKIDPLSLLKNYTPEMLKAYSDGITYNINEESPEGRKRNTINKNMKKLREEQNEDDDIKAIEELKKRMKNKQK